MFITTIIKQGEKIFKLEQNVEDLKEENIELRLEIENLEQFRSNIERLMIEADKKQENYFKTFEKIKKELDVRKTY